MREFLLAAAVFGAVSSAQAADLPILRGAFTDGLTTARTNWQGYYVGGQADYGSITSKLPPGINADMQSTFSPPAGFSYNWLPLGQAHSVNNGYGAFAGYNSQWDDVVLGIELNYLHGGFNALSTSTGLTFNPNLTVASIANSTAALKLTDWGALRLRGGYVIGCFLPYLHFGVGVGSQTVDRDLSAFPPPLPVPPPWAHDSSTKLVYGYSAGFGTDIMLWQGLFARIEYEYLRVTSNIESNINTVRAGLGYKF